MKGTAILIQGESYNDRKAFLLSCIVVARGLIKTLTANIDKYPDLKQLVCQTIESQQEYIKDQLTELTELERWRIRKGLEKNEPYSLKK